MVSIPNRQIGEHIYQNQYSTAYLAQRNNDLRPVLIKLPLGNKNITWEIKQLKQELEAVRQINFSGKLIFKEIYLCNGNYFLEADVTKLLPLKDSLSKKELSLESFLNVAIQITKNLDLLHRQDVILGYLHQESIFIEPQENRIYFSDFSRLMQVGKMDIPDIQSDYTMDNFKNLIYLSPEQVGFLQKPVDFRADLYSLGVLFYKMLTGHFPIKGQTPLEMFHALTAGRIIPIRQLNPQVPEILSQIVLKLMSRNADSRYQSAYSLMKDLQRCLEEWEQRKKISCFPLDKCDIPFALRISGSEKFYGRKRELQILQAALERVSRGSGEIILIKGEAGVGKTRLINQFQKQVKNTLGFFTVGKFHSLKSDEPYQPFIQAFLELFRWIMSRSRAEIIVWKKQFLEKFDADVSYLTEIMPYIEKLIGKQLQDKVKFGAEMEEGFYYSFYKLVQFFARKEKPLVIFLDDLHWADLGTLKIIEKIFREYKISYFLLIGAYRNEEVGEDHPLRQTIAFIKQASTRIGTVCLKPAKLQEIIELIADSFKCNKEDAQPLARFFQEKSRGNYLFIKELLQFMLKNRLIMHRPGGGWQWNLDRINHTEFADDLVNFFIQKVQLLPRTSFILLQLASCIGDIFDIQLLAKLSNQTAAVVEQNLIPCINEGLIQNETKEVYHFVHDRIHQAVYILIPDKKKPRLHYRLACLLLEREEHFKNRSQRVHLFMAVNHLNLGTDVLVEKDEMIRGAKLNFEAGKMAKKSAAFSDALRYQKSALKLLHDSVWQTDYSLLFEINAEYLECLYLCNDYAEGDKLYQKLMLKVKDKLDRVKLRSIKTLYYTKKNFDWEAVRVGLDGLRELGYNIPEKPSIFYIFKELIKIEVRLRKTGIDRIKGLGQVSDAEKKAAMNLLVVLGPCAYNLNDNLLFAISLKVCELSLHYGNFSNSCSGYMPLAMVYIVKMKNFKWGVPLGKIALSLADQYGTNAEKCTVNFLYGAFCLPWLEHVSQSEIYLTKAKEYGLAVSDLTYAGYSMIFEVISMHFRGVPLQEIDDRIDDNLQYVSRIKDPYFIHTLTLYRQFVRSLQGLTLKAGSFNSNTIVEEELLNSFQGIEVKERDQFDYYLLKGQVFYLLGNYKQALLHLKEADRLAEYCFGGEILLADLDFYYCLTVLAEFHNLSIKEKLHYWFCVSKKYRRLRKWAGYCCANFEHKYLLVEAEIARVKCKDQKAFHLYEEAICSAKDNNYFQNAAIACECTAKFCFSRKLVISGEKYLRDALKGYRYWGAVVKVQQMEDLYPSLMKDENQKDQIAVEKNTSVAEQTQKMAQILDIEAIFRATRILSQEIVLEDLLTKIMEITLLNAGADRGALLLNEDKGLYVKTIAGTESAGNNITTLQSVPLESFKLLPHSIINYVNRSAEIIVQNDAAWKGMFTDDPYIIARQPASILCLPIIQHNRVAGVLYMENSGMAGCFDSARVETLKLLCAQMAVSIENAGLYNQLQQLNATLEDKVRGRTAELAEFQKETIEALIKQSKLQERNRIAREIHDTVGHTLTSALIQVEAGKRLLKKNIDLAREKFEISMDQIRRGLNEIRESVHLLGESEQVDEVAHIERFIREIMKNTGVSINYHISENIKLNPAYKHVFYRALQEGITNGIRHGGSKSFDFILVQENESLKFLLKDYGIGAEEVRFGFGLTSMRERVEELGGIIAIYSKIGQGWRIMIKLPLI